VAARPGRREMSKTLNAGQHRLVFTQAVNAIIADDEKFAGFVWKSLLRFNRGDWGLVESEDWKANDADLESLNGGGWYGRILARYGEYPHPAIYITRNTAEEDGTQAVTVLFPSDY
jgi:hypothetical protein